jgi:hypothetical protein
LEGARRQRRPYELFKKPSRVSLKTSKYLIFLSSLKNEEIESFAVPI